MELVPVIYEEQDDADIAAAILNEVLMRHLNGGDSNL